MALLAPLFLLLALLAGPIILLYMLRLRRREVVVSSTLLWQQLLRDRQANAPWQRLRRNILLLLQLLILGALVLALARPFLPVPSVVGGSVVVLLDGSASMQATDVPPTRFDAARAEVETLIGSLGGGDQMTIILVGQTPRVLAAPTGDRVQLRAALAGATPENGPANWPAAAALGIASAQGFSDGRLVVVSDGGLPDNLPPLPTDVVYRPIGVAGDNLAITALATRATGNGPELFAAVANHGSAPATALLSITVDGTLLDVRQLNIPAGDTTAETWLLPGGATIIQAEITAQATDYLALDDNAWAVHESGLTNRALVVTPGNRYLEQIYAVMPDVDAFRAGPDVSLPADPAYDLYVFDSVRLPDPLPEAELFIVNPQSDASGYLSAGTVFSDTAVTRLVDDPLLQFVDWSNIHIRNATAVSAPGLRPLVSAEGGPLLLVGQREGYRVAVLTFDLQQSDLPLQVAFPILIANITNWLSPGRAFDDVAGLLPGDVVPLTPGAGASAVEVERPDGTFWQADVTGGTVNFSATDTPGIYRVRLRTAGGNSQPAGQFAVNLFAPSESRLAPVTTLPLRGTLEATAESDIGRRELWPWLAAVAVVVLLVEWWVFFGGPATSPWPRLASLLRR